MIKNILLIILVLIHALLLHFFGISWIGTTLLFYYIVYLILRFVLLKILFQKNSNHLQDLLLGDLVRITGVVKLEILNGAGKKNFLNLSELLSVIPCDYPTEQTFQSIENNIKNAILSGYSFGITDMIIAQVAKEKNAPLWSLDSDFKNMEKLGFVELYKPKI